MVKKKQLFYLFYIFCSFTLLGSLSLLVCGEKIILPNKEPEPEPEPEPLKNLPAPRPFLQIKNLTLDNACRINYSQSVVKLHQPSCFKLSMKFYTCKFVQFHTVTTSANKLKTWRNHSSQSD